MKICPIIHRTKTEWTNSKLPMTEVMGFPPQGVSAHTPSAVIGGLHAQRSDGRNCSLPFVVLSPGGLSGKALAHGEALSRSSVERDGLAHTALIQRVLGGFAVGHAHSERPRHRPAVRGLPTETRTKRPFWTPCTTNKHDSMNEKDSETGQRDAVSLPKGHVGFFQRLKSWAFTLRFL